MFGRGVTVGLGGKLCFLQIGIGCHATILVIMRETKHAVIQRMETGERDELKFVSHRAQLPLKFLYGCRIEFLLPVERRRAIVG